MNDTKLQRNFDVYTTFDAAFAAFREFSRNRGFGSKCCGCVAYLSGCKFSCMFEWLRSPAAAGGDKEEEQTPDGYEKEINGLAFELRRFANCIGNILGQKSKQILDNIIKTNKQVVDEKVLEVKFYEVEFDDGFSIAIKSLYAPSHKDAAGFCFYRYGSVKSVTEIPESEVRAFFDCSNIDKWPVLGLEIEPFWKCGGIKTENGVNCVNLNHVREIFTGLLQSFVSVLPVFDSLVGVNRSRNLFAGVLRRQLCELEDSAKSDQKSDS